MSCVSEFELEDILWEFGDNDDHIVPHPGLKKRGSVVERDSVQRPQTELKCAESADSGCCADNVIGWKDEGSVEAVKQGKETMLEKSPWSRSSNGSLSASLDGDSNRKSARATSEERWTSEQCLSSSNMNSAVDDFCSNDPILGDQTGHHQLSNGSHTENDLPFLGHGLEDKDSHDLLFYGWPALENLDDINMFRGCDSTFGLELDDNDDLSWFTSSHAIGGSDDALKSSLDFPGLDPCGPNNGLVATDSVKKLTPVSCKTNVQNSTPSIPSSVHSYTKESAAIPHRDSQSQACPSKHQKYSEELVNDWPLEDGVSYIQFDKLIDGGDGNHCLNLHHSVLKDNSQGGEIIHQTRIPKPVLCNSGPSDHVLPSSTPSVTKSESDGISSITLRDSSHASNQMQSVESFHVVSVQNPTSGKKKKDGHHQRRLARCIEKTNFKVQTAGSAPRSSRKPICISENEAEGQSEVDGENIGIQRELDSCSKQDSSCVSSVLDEVSVDARSLQQLQHVMEQLDIRTKLCIRDSLYRLARSAEQRHKCFNQISGRPDDNDANGALLSDGTNKSAGFIETDTNPIDRSIAHLLFHRPTDPSGAATHSDTVALKSHTMIPATNRDPLMSEKQVYGVESTSTSEGSVCEL